MKKIVLIMTIIFCSCFLQAKNIISLTTGSAIPISWNYGTAFYAGFSQGYSISKHKIIGLDISYNFNHKDSTGAREIKILNIIPFIEYDFFINEIIAYVYTGFGISLVNIDDDLIIPDIDDMTKRYFTAIGGLGLMYCLVSNIYIGIDFKYQHIFHSGNLINNFIPTTKISYVF